MNLRKKISYASKVLPGATSRALGPAPRGPVHLIIAMADHFEPAIDPAGGPKRVPLPVREYRLEWWTREYPKAVDRWRDHDGRPFVHSYFYPAEQYHEGLLQMLADHCHSGWGEVEIHLHHGETEPATPEDTRRVLTEFRDHLAFRHGCLAVEEGLDQPRYAFVHGNFALANSANGEFCGVDSEMRILADTGCYADFTMPTALHHPSQTVKINSIYECALPLECRAPQRKGRDLKVGREPQIFPLIVQGPLLSDLKRSGQRRRLVLDNAALTRTNPMTLQRLELWKQARITIKGRPDWLFVKLHCHGMDPGQQDVVVGDGFRKFLEALVSGAANRKETLHFVTAREMTNIILAACAGKEGNPGNYRDYRLKQRSNSPMAAVQQANDPVSVKG